MKQRPDKALIEEVAILKVMENSFVEKNWFVTEIIKIISEIKYEGFEVIFTGGTALSKAHHLLQRFSEDIDFRILVLPQFNKRSLISKFKKSVVNALASYGFLIKPEQIKARDSNRFFSIDLDYESYFPRADALRPHVQIEMTVRGLQLPQIYLSVASFINELVKQTSEVPRIGCIDPVESAADKLSAIAWRIPDRVRGDQNDDPSIVRHIHDLAILKDRALAHPRFRELVSVSMQDDRDRARNVLSLNKMPNNEKLTLMLTTIESDNEYFSEYDRFVKSVSYAKEDAAPDFANAMQTIRYFIQAIA